MRHRFAFQAFGLWACCLLACCLMPTCLSADGLVPERAGAHKRAFDADGFELRFGIEVPDVAAEDGPRPLILALHYGGFDPSKPFPKYYGQQFAERVVSPGVRDLGAFVVAPDSHGHPWANSPVVEPVLALLDALVADPRIDGDRVVVMGYSMGGTGTWYFAAKHRDRLAAAVPMAGRMRTEWLAETAGLSIFALYSRDDELISSDQVREALQEAKIESIRFTEIQGVTHYQSPLYAQAIQALIVPWLREVLGLPASP